MSESMSLEALIEARVCYVFGEDHHVIRYARCDGCGTIPADVIAFTNTSQCETKVCADCLLAAVVYLRFKLKERAFLAVLEKVPEPK